MPKKTNKTNFTPWEQTIWGRNFQVTCSSSWKEALDIVNNYEGEDFDLYHNNDTGEWLWSIVIVKGAGIHSGFWLESCKTKKAATSLKKWFIANRKAQVDAYTN